MEPPQYPFPVEDLGVVAVGVDLGHEGLDARLGQHNRVC